MSSAFDWVVVILPNHLCLSLEVLQLQSAAAAEYVVYNLEMFSINSRCRLRLQSIAPHF